MFCHVETGNFRCVPVADRVRDGLDRTTLAGIYANYMGTHGLAAVVIGWFVDRVGPRAVYTSGLLIYGLPFY
ncbi:MAG: hypothetical protein CM1200mP18_04860 [Gammaproteobacteria bacterium]|nr:MAG: hypothetical protein CM1200mP18_04860 [Gammaproteobacteria bacterium]